VALLERRRHRRDRLGACLRRRRRPAPTVTNPPHRGGNSSNGPPQTLYVFFPFLGAEGSEEPLLLLQGPPACLVSVCWRPALPRWHWRSGDRPSYLSAPRREGPRSAAEWSSPWKRSFCASRQDRNKTVSCRGHRHSPAMCVHADRPSGPLAQHAFGQFRYEGVARGAGDPRRDRRRRLRFGVKLLTRQDVVRRVLSTVGSCRRIVCDSYPKRVFG
jgi:hypothetical protein